MTATQFIDWEPITRSLEETRGSRGWETY